MNPKIKLNVGITIVLLSLLLVAVNPCIAQTTPLSKPHHSGASGENIITSETLMEMADIYTYFCLMSDIQFVTGAYRSGRILIAEGIVGKPMNVGGRLHISAGKMEWNEFEASVAHHSLMFSVYSGDTKIYVEYYQTNEFGTFDIEYIPRESGYYKAVITSFNGTGHEEVADFPIHVTQPLTPTPTSKTPTFTPSLTSIPTPPITTKTPGFELISAIAGLLVMVYLLRREE